MPVGELVSWPVLESAKTSVVAIFLGELEGGEEQGEHDLCQHHGQKLPHETHSARGVYPLVPIAGPAKLSVVSASQPPPDHCQKPLGRNAPHLEPSRAPSMERVC